VEVPDVRRHGRGRLQPQLARGGPQEDVPGVPGERTPMSTGMCQSFDQLRKVAWESPMARATRPPEAFFRVGNFVVALSVNK
jgi:hypothetical protein